VSAVQGKLDFIRVDNNGLFTPTISAVTAVIALGVVFAVAEMIVHLRIQCSLNDLLFELCREGTLNKTRLSPIAKALKDKLPAKDDSS